VVGAYRAYAQAGAAYTFTLSGATWSTGALLGSGSVAGDNFGKAVAVAMASVGTGATVVVGASSAYTGAGAAYAFTKSGATWSTGALLGSGSVAGGEFGKAVAMAMGVAGPSAVVGAPNAYAGAGAAYTFTMSGATWSTGALLGSGGAGAMYGRAVAMGGTGSFALVGVPFADFGAGAAYVWLG
jgi:hypothetical protein